jgi:ABC-type proline/glycine betaine transport system ATPase subunit
MIVIVHHDMPEALRINNKSRTALQRNSALG